MLVTYECEECGKKYERHPSKDEGRFCSRECYQRFMKSNPEKHPDWKGGKLSRKCLVCGEEFETYPSQNKRFCSKNCYYKHRIETGEVKGKNNPSWNGGKIKLECEQCGGIFKVSPARKKVARFCSMKCLQDWQSDNWKKENNPFWQGGYEGIDYGANWKKQRKKAIERDNFECQVCGMENQNHKNLYGRNLDVHHKRPFREFEDYREANKLDNLVTLCRSCHMKIEWSENNE